MVTEITIRIVIHPTHQLKNSDMDWIVMFTLISPLAIQADRVADLGEGNSGQQCSHNLPGGYSDKAKKRRCRSIIIIIIILKTYYLLRKNNDPDRYSLF